MAPCPPRPGRRRSVGAAAAGGLLAAMTLAALLAPVPPATAGPAAGDDATGTAASARRANPAQRRRELQSEQQGLQARLARMKKELAEKEAAHSEATDALAASESAISAANRRLRELAAERSGVERQLADVRSRQRAAASRQGEHEQHLAVLLQDLVAGGDEPVAPPGWLAPRPGGAGAADVGVDGDGALVLSGYLIADRVHAIGALRDRRVELASLEQEARDRQDQLVRIAIDERLNHSQLVHQQDARRRTLASLSRQIAHQQRSVASLERDEKRLGNLIQELVRVLAAPPRRLPPRGGGSDATAGAPAAVEPPAGSGFAQLRGRLRLPVAGEIGARFGSSRQGEDGEPQAGAPSWKGVFIRAVTGVEVHAVAAGRVVFADWLRGFGNLIIVDHGEGFISVYGNNETLLHSAGERVTADEVIATVGNTGGSAESGLYFELRYEGRPFDPLAWVSSR